MTEVFEADVKRVLDEVRDVLVAKNKAYGNSALSPVRVLSQACPVEQLLVRIDDKLSRLRTTGPTGPDGEDTLMDTIGYFVLLKLALEVNLMEAPNVYE